MNAPKKSGFFCVVYFSDTKKTAYYHKVYTPAKLADKLDNWKWIKIFVDKSIYFNNTKTLDFTAIFDEKNAVKNFNFNNFK